MSDQGNVIIAEQQQPRITDWLRIVAFSFRYYFLHHEWLYCTEHRAALIGSVSMTARLQPRPLISEMRGLMSDNRAGDMQPNSKQISSCAV